MNIGTLTVTFVADMTQLDKMTTGLSSISQRFRTFGYLASTALTLPMVMAGKASFQMAKDYEYSMQKIVGLTGVAQDIVNVWSSEILAMGPKLGQMPKDLADSLYFISSSGIKGAEAMQVLELSAKAATSGLGETKDVANVLTSALNAYRGTGLTAAHATDVLIAGVREGKAEATGFATAIGQLIPLAAQLGVSFDQVAGGVAAVTLTGASAANAAVYMKGIFNTLITASTQGEKALATMGSSYGALRNILSNQGLVPLMQKLRDMQMKWGDEMMSDVIPNIRAMTFFLSFAGKNFQYNTELMNRMNQSTGSLGKAFAAVAETIKVKYDMAISQAQGSLISLGKSIATAFLPLLEGLVKKLSELTTWFNSLSDAQKRNKLEWLLFIAILGPASLLISLLGYALSGLVTIVKGAIIAFNFLRVILLTNPYTMLIGLIATVIGGFLLLKNKAEDAAKAHDKYNTALVAVNGSLKKLKDLTSTDYSVMSMKELSDAREMVKVQWEIAKAKLAQAETNLEDIPKWQKWLGMNQGNNKFADAQMKVIGDLKTAYADMGKVMDDWANNFEKNTDAANKNITPLVKSWKQLQEEIKKAHKLILEQYDAQLKKENELLDLQDRMRELQGKEPIDYRKFFLKTGFQGGRIGQTPDPTTILENWNARGLISERTFLDDKFKMDIASAGENADARMKIETQYYNDIRKLRQTDMQLYLNSASNAITAISSLIESSKQKELSAAGSNAKRRARIEEEYMQKQKGWAIAQAIINGALAVTNLIANVPLSVLNPATWVGIGIAAAATAAQVAIIAGQGMAGGGIVPSGYPNDTYPAMLTSGETVTPPNKLSNISRQNDNMPREVLIKFQNGSLEGYINYNARKQASYS